MRKEIPYILMLLFAAGRVCLEAFYRLEAYKLKSGDKLVDSIGFALTFMECAAMFLGFLNLFRIHGNNIRRKRPNWGYSVWLLAVLVAYTILGLAKTNTDKTYQWIWQAVYVPLDATMFSLLAFFIASAAYRAFRVRNLEAGLMLAVALVVMLAQVPLGEVIWGTDSWLGGIPGISNWILSVANAAGMRAISLGIFLGLMATQTRVLLGIERRFLGQD